MASNGSLSGQTLRCHVHLCPHQSQLSLARLLQHHRSQHKFVPFVLHDSAGLVVDMPQLIHRCTMGDCAPDAAQVWLSQQLRNHCDKRHPAPAPPAAQPSPPAHGKRTATSPALPAAAARAAKRRRAAQPSPAYGKRAAKSPALSLAAKRRRALAPGEAPSPPHAAQAAAAAAVPASRKRARSPPLPDAESPGQGLRRNTAVTDDDGDAERAVLSPPAQTLERVARERAEDSNRSTETNTRECPVCHDHVTTLAKHTREQHNRHVYTDAEHQALVAFGLRPCAHCTLYFSQARGQRHAPVCAANPLSGERDDEACAADIPPAASAEPPQGPPPPVVASDHRVPSAVEVATHPNTIDSIPGPCVDDWIALCRAVLRPYEAASNRGSKTTIIAQFLTLAASVLARRRSHRDKAARRNRGLSIVLRAALAAVNRGEAVVRRAADSTDEQHAAPVHPAAADAAAPAPQLDDDTRRVLAARRQIRLGHVARAGNALGATGTADVTDPAVIDQLRALHPQGDLTDLPALPDAAPRTHLDHTNDALTARIKKWAGNGAAAGPSGLPGRFIVPLLDDVECRRSLFALLTDIANGDVDVDATQLLLSSTLIPILKPQSTAIRPLAVGEVLCRLAGRHNMAEAQSAVDAFFADNIQLACGAPGGAQTAARVLQTAAVGVSPHSLLDISEASCLIDLDARNAFNTQSRSIMLKRLFDEPSLSKLWRYSHWLLSTATPLVVSNRGRVLETLLSCEGARQGDVLGTLLYAVGVHEEYKATAAFMRERWLARDEQTRGHEPGGIAITDNFTLYGPAVDVIAGADFFRRAMANRHDIQIKDGGKVIWMHVTPPPECLVTYAQDAKAQLVHGVGQVTTLLGIPMGDEVLVVEETRARAERMLHPFRLLTHPDMPLQEAHGLLRLCAGGVLTHMLRCMPPELTAPAMAVLGSLHETFLDRLLGWDLSPEAQSTECIKSVLTQSVLPFRHGGFLAPLPDPRCAFLAGVAQAAPLLGSPALRPATLTDPELQRDVTLCLQSLSPALAGLSADERALLVPPTDDGLDFLDMYFASPPPQSCPTDSQQHVPAADRPPDPGSAPKRRAYKLQHKLTSAVHKDRRAALERELSPAGLARLRAVSEKGAALFMLSIPDGPDKQLTDADYMMQVRTFAGLGPVPGPQSIVCALCNTRCTTSENSDEDAPSTHLLSCKGSLRTSGLRRHDGVALAFARYYREAGCRVYQEPTKLNEATADKPDLEVRLVKPVLGKFALFVDVTVVHPLTNSRVASGADTNKTLRQAERAKRMKGDGKYLRMAEANAAVFMPAALSVFGVPGPCAKRLLTMDYASVLDNTELKHHRGGVRGFVNSLQRAVACAIVRGNGAMWRETSKEARQLFHALSQRHLLHAMRHAAPAEQEAAAAPAAAAVVAAEGEGVADGLAAGGAVGHTHVDADAVCRGAECRGGSVPSSADD